MTRACPPPRELTRLIDGEVTENRAAELRTHAAACGACARELEAQRTLVARVAAPVPGVPSEGAHEALSRRLDAAERPRDAVAPSRRAWAVGGLAAAALAVVVVVPLVRGAPDRGEFQARGAPVEWTRKVGVELWALDGGPRKLAAGDRLAPGVALVGSFSNVDSAPAWLLAYALDARGEVHWLYPAFVDPRSDPGSIRLDASVVQRALPDSVVLEDVPPGALRLVLVVSRAPLRVSAVEREPAAGRTPEALRARWPDARVDEVPVVFGSPPAREVRP
ncbi:MAG TPA: hypothetical protein VFL83_01265 [Anaeromyxobacter sp.]|nr:hypothetical protein [Anaeromyxobacter sp.]